MSEDESAARRASPTAPGVFSRRRMLGTTTLAVAGAALAAEPRANAQQPQNVRTGEHNASATDPGPEK
jgi:hypothetical protein